MRKRKRPDWPVMVYKYWAEPRGELPEAVWTQARAMQKVWNTLVEMRERAALEAVGLEEKESQSIWAQYQQEIIHYIRSPEVSDHLDWAAREFVFDRFKETARAAAKQKGSLRQHHCLDRVIIPHRFTNGGVPPKRLFTNRKVRVRLRPVSPEAYDDARRETVRLRITSGDFRVGNQRIEFNTILHRPIPEDSIVKGFSWCGERHPTRGWRWSINITVEHPPYSPHPHTGRVCSIDFGWRILGDYLRIGMISDSAGNVIEVRLPLTGTGTSFTRRYQLPDSFKDVHQMNTRLNTLVDECKVQLKEVLPSDLPDELQELVEKLGQMRQGGLLRLLRSMEKQVESDNRQEFVSAVEVLRQWLEKNDSLRKRRNDTQDRLIGRRRWLYGNLASWLAKRYDMIVWEGELRISNLSVHLSDTANPYALENSRKYRNWAAIGELRNIIRRAVVKEGGELIDGQMAYSTITCAQCGAKCEPSDKLILECPQGHEFDQDVNASINLLSEAQAHTSNERVPLCIPNILSSILVP